jgi:hypothetical protein
VSVVFVVQHTRQVGEFEDVKLVGVYSSECNARGAVERLSQQPGFRDTPEGFSIDAHELDRDCWSEGFAAMTTILVRLLEESVDVWRPVCAEVLPGDVYEIQGPVPEGEVWEFPPGTRVRCEGREFDSGPGVVAVTRAV